MGALILFFSGWSAALYFIGPENLVGFLGFTNTYLTSFVLGILGGSSLFTSTAYYVTIFSFAKTGLNPYVLGILGGLGLTIGDSLFYFLGRESSEIASGKFKKKIEAFGRWLSKKPKSVILLFSFLYTGFTPFPNDLLMISTGLSKYSYKIIAVGDLLGNIVFLTALGVLAA